MTDILNALAVMFRTDGLFGHAHLAVGLGALILGPVVLARPKGTRGHRLGGYTYVVLMAILNISALSMYRLSGGPNLFHLFAVVSLSTITPGIYFAVRARRTGSRSALITHYHLMSWSYFGLLAAFLSQLATHLGPVHPEVPFPPAALIGAVTGGGAVIAGLWIQLRARRVLSRYGA